MSLVKNLVAACIFAFLTGCMNGPNFGSQSNATNNTNASEGKEVAAKVLEEVEGIIAGEFSASANSAQFLSASSNSTIDGAKISIAPNSLAIDTTISVEEGGHLASGTLLQQMTGNAALGVTATTNTVMVTPTIPTDLSQPMTVLISIPDSSGLIETDNPALVVFYKVFKKSENKWYAGYITRDKLKIVGSFVEFPTQHFGSFQAAILNTEIKEAKEIKIESSAISKKTENALPAITWGEYKLSFDSKDRSVSLAVVATGHQDIELCEVFGDNDQVAPYEIREKIEKFATKAKVSFNRAEALVFSVSCLEKNGRVSQSPWSQKLSIPEKIEIAANPPVFAKPAALTLIVSIAMKPVSIVNTGANPNNCNVKPALPAGLTISKSADTCVISGTPTASTTSSQAYTIYAEGADKSVGTTTIDIVVKAKNPPILANISSLIFTATKAIAPINFTNTGSSVVTCSVSPSLPAGIVIALSGTTCAVSGTPAAATAGNVYTVTSSGEDTTTSTATLTFTVEAAKPPVFSDLGDQNLTTTVEITPVSYTNTGFPAMSCSSAPTLPAGLQLDPISSTCKISGSPTTPRSGQVYKITGTASDGTVGSGNVYIAVAAASPPNLADAGSKTGVKDSTFNSFTFSNSGSPAISCISVPNLPNGLNLSVHASSCKIYGTPTVVLSLATFAVTAKAADGSASTANIDISVNSPNPPIFGSPGSQNFLLGYAKTVDLTNTGGEVSSCTTSPTLPGGLSATKSGNTCRISGTPNALSAIDTYILTGTATDGTTGTTSFTLTVASPNPPNLQSKTAQVWAKNIAIPGLEFTNLGAPAVSCISAPSLPSGLSVVPANPTCKIQGTPTSLTTAANYMITATASDSSSGTVNTNIAIVDGNPPALADIGELTFDVGTQISPITFLNTGSNALACAPDKQLPAGLTLSSNNFTCLISGTPTEFSPNVDYTITATASDNSTDTATIGISIKTPGNLSRKSTQRHLVYDIVTDMHWLFYRDATQVNVAYSKNKTTWKKIGTPSITSNDFSVAIQNGLIFIAYVNGQNISFQRGITSDGATPSIAWEQAQTVSTAISGETYTNPSISIANNILYIGSIFSKNGAKQPRVAISSSTFNSNGLTFTMSNLPYGTRYSEPEIALVPRGTSVLAVIKGTADEIRSFAYESGFWQEKGGNISEWGDSFTGINGSVNAVTMFKGDIYIGGAFTYIGGNAISRIAKWDGLNWTPLGSGLDSTVFAMAVKGNDLYVGGSFSTAGGSGIANIAKWNGTNWSGLSSGSGLDGTVHAIITDANYVYAGGEFINADNVVRNRIAIWDPSTTLWESFGTGINGTVYALAKMGTDIFAGGLFTSAGSAAATNIARWSSSATPQWSALGSGVSGTVRALAVKEASLYVGGDFTQINPSTVSTYLAKWYSNNWIAITGLNDSVLALKVVGDKLYVGGNFTNAGVSGAKKIAIFDGSWQSLGGTINDSDFVKAIESGLPASNIYISGNFTSAASRVALYKTGIIAKAGKFSVTGSSTRTLIAYMKNDTGIPYIATYLSSWGETQIPGSANASAQIQISCKSDDATKYVVTWDLIAGQIYSRTSAGATSTFGISGNTAPRLPITYETGGQPIPVIWDNSSNFVGVGKSTTPP